MYRLWYLCRCLPLRSNSSGRIISTRQKQIESRFGNHPERLFLSPHFFSLFFQRLCVSSQRFLVRKTTMRNVKRNGRAFLAWGIIVSFMFFFVVKAFHHHEEKCSVSCTHSDEPTEEHSDCAICLFAFSPFTQSPVCEFQCLLTLLPFELSDCLNDTGFALPHFCFRRGPPTC